MEPTTDTASGGLFHEKPSRTVVQLIADLEDTSPANLSPPLYSVVDPDALDALFHASKTGESDTERYLQFTYRGYEVGVRNDGHVAISEA